MKIKMPVLLLLLILMIASVGRASPPFPLAGELNFGQVTAPSEQQICQVFNLPTQGNSVKYLEFWLEENPRSEVNQLELAPDQFFIEVAEKSLEISTTPVTLAVEELQVVNVDSYIPLLLGLKIVPQNLPGVYETVLHIRKVNQGGNGVGETCDLAIRVEVAPWITMAANGVLDLDLSDIHLNAVQNQLPYTIQLASNVNWSLYGWLNPGTGLGTDSAIELSMSTPLHERKFEELYPNGITLPKEPVLLAVGPETVSGGKYWVEIPVNVRIQNYTKLASGQFNFILFFSVQN